MNEYLCLQCPLVDCFPNAFGCLLRRACEVEDKKLAMRIKYDKRMKAHSPRRDYWRNYKRSRPVEIVENAL
jgi:hypothetical protein